MKNTVCSIFESTEAGKIARFGIGDEEPMSKAEFWQKYRNRPEWNKEVDFIQTAPMFGSELFAEGEETYILHLKPEVIVLQKKRGYRTRRAV